MTQITLSIIIPAYNETLRLPATLAVAAAGQEILQAAGVTTECLVVDNNSTDDTAAVAAALGVRVVFEPVNQIARARNVGARASTGEWMLFLDADSHPPTALWEDFLAVLSQAQCMGGGATLQQDGKHWLFGMALHFWNAWSRLSKDAAGAFLFCRRASFEAVGGFDERYFAGEEVDFCRRLKRYGRPLGQRLTILSAHPLITSARKAELYTLGEFLSFMGKTVFRGGRTLLKREDCPIWYDGRR